jgi:hypothetical protein
VMSIFTLIKLAAGRRWRRDAAIFLSGLTLCALILVITVYEKFTQGGWITLAVTGALVGVCFLIRRHYTAVASELTRAFSPLEQLPPAQTAATAEPDPAQPVAVVLVASFGGFGIHTMLNALGSFPNHFKGIVFASVGVIDSGGFKGEGSIDLLRQGTEESLRRYVEAAKRQGMPAAARLAIGTDAVEEAERLCLQIGREFPRATFFAGQVIFKREAWYQRLLHNQTAYAIQRRLQLAEKSMVILPARIG